MNLFVVQSYEGRLLARSDKKGEIEDLSKLISLRPSHPWYYTGRAWAKLNVGDKKGAVEDYTSAINLRPNAYSFYTDRSKAWNALGNSKKANLDLERAKIIKQTSGE